MKFVASILLTAILSFAGALFFPWWIIAIAAFIVAVIIHQNALVAFIAGFLAVFILWVVHSSIIDIKNQHILSSKVASILPLGGSYIILIVVTGIVGGLVAGFAAMTGSFTRRPGNKRVGVQ